MASDIEIVHVLEMLQAAYPSYKPGNVGALVDLYTRKLAKYSYQVLEAAADRIIDESRWFPQISDLVKICEALELEKHLAERAAPEDLRALALELEDAQEMDQGKWAALAERFWAVGRECGAAALMEKYQRMAEALGAAALP